VGRTECNPVFSTDGSIHIVCNTVYDKYYDRSGYILVLMYRYDDGTERKFEIEVTLEEYRQYDRGDTYPRDDDS